MKNQLNGYPIDKCWNIYLQIEAFYKEAKGLIWKTTVFGTGGSNPSSATYKVFGVVLGKPSLPLSLSIPL